MVDLHCHILPMVDDGPVSLDDALAMARFLVADGITHVVATPHCHRYIHLLRADVVPLVNEFNEQLASARIPLNVLPGSEIQVTDTEAYRREFEAGLYCHLGDRHAFTLTEFSWARQQYPSDAADLIRWIRQQGMIPIIAHPERHDYFLKEVGLLQMLIDAGAWIQITVDSLLGNHGPDPKVAADQFLRKYPDAVLASDAHNPGRCSGLSVGYSWVGEHLSKQRLDDLRIRAEQVLNSMMIENDEATR